jgi:hypothetical protein
LNGLGVVATLSLSKEQVQTISHLNIKFFNQTASKSVDLLLAVFSLIELGINLLDDKVWVHFCAPCGIFLVNYSFLCDNSKSKENIIFFIFNFVFSTENKLKHKEN